jgi:hypothetical protein
VPAGFKSPFHTHARHARSLRRERKS